ncbi:hypothetical protein ACP275_06G005000 [Erythranthe tilingii]
MKFLGWMHRKVMQNSTELIANSKTGSPSACLSVQTMFDEHSYYVKPTKSFSHSNIKCQKISKSNRMEANNMEELIQEESFEPFDFLAIGTFGTELLNTDPPTPTFSIPFEESTNKQTGIIENDLKLINYELEKFLEAQEKDIGNDTSARGNDANTITLSNKQLEGADSEDHMFMKNCPLQNYLFGTPVELVETDKEVQREKTSLEELFKRNNIIHDDFKTKSDAAEQKPKKKDAAYFMKKVVKKFYSSPSSSMASSKSDAAVSLSIKKKLSKALKKFQRKIHPEEINDKRLVKMKKGENKDISHADAGQIGGDNEDMMVDQAIGRKSENNTLKLYSEDISKGATAINGGHWIKTDSDYLVLEL